ncbi:CYTH domain [Carpediemonas membranifera]|uniref:CYTH domain n=1 Tax=Carpediemonas membranifera TaxID=201153 RepID=A0A8J6AV90_9EUKA|nr:CYTH domain [Carpediemonas membranifera]|eukprot:KAG9392445.1 CYTH domain [Carpediemonas membranifera]
MSNIVQHVAKEIEIKFHLASLADYSRFAAHISARHRQLKAQHQTNTFFDTKGFDLEKKRIGLRLREIREGSDVRFVCTMKVPIQGVSTMAGGVQRHHEIEFDATNETAATMLAMPSAVPSILIGGAPAEARELAAQVFGSVDEDTMECTGSFTNYRRTFLWHDMALELDETTFPGNHVAYEIEVETTDPDTTMTLLQADLAASGAESQPSTASKLGRFRQYQREQ